MNRQLRRATEKSDKKREKERDKRRGPRRAARQSTKAQAKPAPKETRKAPEPRSEQVTAKSSEKSRRQQRWAGIYVLMTVVIIGLQAILPEQEMDTFSQVIHGMFYLTFGYFLTSWLFRRGTPQAFLIALVTGGLLALGVELVKFFRPEVTADPLLVYIALPSLLLGALLSRFVYVRTG